MTYFMAIITLHVVVGVYAGLIDYFGYPVRDGVRDYIRQYRLDRAEDRYRRQVNAAENTDGGPWSWPDPQLAPSEHYPVSRHVNQLPGGDLLPSQALASDDQN